MSRFYLGIDPGQTTGWALLNAGGYRLGSGLWKLKRPNEPIGLQYMRLVQNLDEAARLDGDLIFAYEDVIRHAGTQAAHVYGGMIATLTAWCEAHERKYHAISVQAAKICGTGSGGAKKVDMVIAANERWDLGVEFTSRQIPAKPTKRGQHPLPGAKETIFLFDGRDNECDALWIAEAARQELERRR